MSVWTNFFNSGPFMPHGHCYFWTKSLIGLHAISDALIVLAYYSIPVTLVHFVRKRKDLEFHWMFVCFAVFILACGTTHLLEIWNIWHGNYWLSGSVKAITALASVPTSILLVKLVPQALALPSPGALKKAHDELEIRVRERTADLLETTRKLQAEINERRQAEEALNQNQHLLQSIIDNSTAVIYVKDLEGRYTLVNRRFTELFHLGQQAIGKTDYEMFPKATAEAFRTMDKRVAGGGVTLTDEESAPHDDGLHTYISVKSPLRDTNGKTYSIFGISTDISDRKRVEDALRASEERTRLIVENALDAVITIDGAGCITGWNSQAETIFGWNSSEALGQALKDTIIPPRYREAHERGLQRYLDTNEAVVLGKRIEMSALHRDGHEFPIELAIIPLRIGDRLSFSAFVRDITERKETEQKFHTQLARLALLSRTTRAIAERQDLQSIFQVVIRSLEDHLPIDFGCVCLCDPAREELTVASVGARSQPLAMELALPEKERIKVDQNGLSRCVHGQLVYEEDISRINFSFPQRLAQAGLRSVVLAPLAVESNIFGVLIAGRRDACAFSSADCEFLRQLSEHVALAAHQTKLYGALQQAYDDLRQTQQAVLQQERLRALGQMASGIAHDINNALSPVALYTESLLEKEQNLSERGREYLTTVGRAIDDVAATVARMREFYRQREPQLKLTPVNLNQLVEQVINLTRARWSDMPQQRGIVIKMETRLERDLPAIMGVESEIREVLTNLVFNAVDAMPDGGALTIRTRSESRQNSDRMAIVEVADTGIGMDDETRRRCLEPFFTTKGERGTGLGLAMVYGAVERHGGEIEIETALGRGTTMKLNFAVRSIEPVMSGETGHRPTVASRLRILAVDDDPVLLKSLRDILETDGHAVVVANNGQEGIHKFHEAREKSEPFDVVITDLGMPHVDGRVVAGTVKQLCRTTPVILLTGWGQRLVAEGEVPPHVDCVLSKPPKLRDLREALARCWVNKSNL